MRRIPDTFTVASSSSSPTDGALQSGDLFANAFHFAPIPISVSRINDGMMLDANGSLLDFFGLSREEVVGRTALELGIWRDEAQRGQVLDALAREGRLTDVAMKVTVRSGEARDVLVSAVAIEVGGEPCMLSMARDVTERKSAEKALRESESRFRQLFEAASDIIAKVDLESGVCEYVSPAVLEVTGFTQDEYTALGPRNFRRRIHPEDWPQYKRRFEGILELGAVVGETQRHEYRWQCKDGRYRWLADSISIISDKDGSPRTLVATVRDMTERRESEEALRQSEQRFSRIFQTAPVCIGITRIDDGRFIDVNESFLELVGCDRGEVIGRTSADLGLWAEPADRDLMLQALLQGETVRDFESQVRRKSGEIRDTLSSFVTVEIGGQPCIVGMFRDVTERKQAEEALRESEDKYRSLIENLREGIWTIDKDACTTFANPAMAEMLGYAVDEMLGRHLFSFMDEQGQELAKRKLEHRQQGVSEQHDFEFARKDGSRLCATIETSPLTDRDGNYNGALAGVMDITARKRAEEELRESEERFRTLSASAPIGIFLMGDKGQVIYTNKRLQAIAGVPPGGGSMGELATAVHPDDREQLLAEWAKAAEERAELSQEYRILTKQGETRWIRMHVCPIFSADGGQGSVVGTIEDVTEHKEAVERERRLHEQEARTRELRTTVRVLEQMAATLGHELRNPLGVISNSAYFLSSQAGISDARALKHAEIIGREVQSAKRVIDDILEFAHVSQIVPAPASLNAIVDQALARSQIPANIRVTRKRAPDLPPLVCDADRLERAFLDVIANAVQAMPRGGRLIVKTRLSAGSVQAVFSDTGEGIAPENLTKVFDPMFTTKLRGIGLGLTVVRRTVKQHGGQVELKSKLEHGTSVIMTLPLTPVDPTSGNSVPVDAPRSAA